VIGELTGAGFPAKVCCRLLGVSSPGYYKYRKRPLSPTRMRRQWLTGLIREVHTASRGTYGSRRIHAELTRGMDVRVSEHLVAELMSLAGIAGLPGPAKVKRLRGIATSDDLVHRKFHRLSPNELWVTDITEHPTREGKVYCCAVMDTFSRRIVGWSIDSSQDSPWSSTPSTWPSKTDARAPAVSSMPTTASSSPPGPSPTRSAAPA
jgi:putative transposase